jgi:hypothetical protein
VNKVRVDFDDIDAKLLNWLVRQFDQGGDSFDEAGLVAGTSVDHSIVQERLDRFCRFEMVSRVTRGGLWRIEPQLLSVAEHLSTPESPPDRIDEATKWFRRQWWSVPLWFAFTVVPLVLLPAIVGWFAIVRWVLNMFSD